MKKLYEHLTESNLFSVGNKLKIFKKNAYMTRVAFYRKGGSGYYFKDNNSIKSKR